MSACHGYSKQEWCMVVLPQVVCQMPLNKPPISLEIYVVLFVCPSLPHVLFLSGPKLSACPLKELAGTQPANRGRGSSEGTDQHTALGTLNAPIGAMTEYLKGRNRTSSFRDRDGKSV